MQDPSGPLHTLIVGNGLAEAVTCFFVVEGVCPVQSAIEPFLGVRILRADLPFIGTKVIVWLAGWPLYHLD